MDDEFEDEAMTAECTGCGATAEECGASFMGWPHQECTNPNGGTWHKKDADE